MTAIDWIIVALVLFMATQGYRQGFIVGALSFAGFVGGAFVGTRLGPKLLTGGSSFVPAVRRIFDMRFGRERIRTGNEFTSVARGLALVNHR